MGGLEREQSDEAIPGQQPADIGGSAPLNATTTVQYGGGGTQSSACAPTHKQDEEELVAEIKLEAGEQ